MAHVVGHLSVTELRAGYRGGGDATRARHHQVIWLLAQGRTVAETARPTSFAPRWIEELLARHDAFGPSSLGDRRRGNGAKARVLTPDVLDTLRERLKTLPDDGGVWTSRKVAAVMAAELGLGSVAEQRGWEARAARSAGRSRGRARATSAQRAPRSDPRSKKAPRGRRRGGRAPSRRGDRDLCHRRASHRARAAPHAASGRHVARARWRWVTTASNGSTSPPSSRPPPARASGTSPQGFPGATSRTSSRSSPVRPVRGQIASSCSCSTTPAGTARRASPCPMA